MNEAELRQSGAQTSHELLLSAFATTLKVRQSVPEVLRTILDLSRQLISADAYAVWRSYDGHRTWRAIATHGLSPNHPIEHKSEEARLGPTEIEVISDVNVHPLVERQREAYARDGIRSLLILPMNLDGEVSGTITFYFRSARTFGDQDLQYATALVNFASGALRTSELYEKNVREKGRLHFLLEASTVLASSLDYELTLERVAQLAVPHIADWCTVHILEGEDLVRVAVAHVDPAQLELARQFSQEYPEKIRPDRGIGMLLRTGESQFVEEITDEMLVQAAQDEKHLRIIRELGITSVILVPLKSRGRVLGAIRLIATGRMFTEDDLHVAESLATRAAVAVDNARLYREVLTNANQLRLSHTAARMGSWSWDLVKQQIHWSEEFKLLHGLSPDMTPSYEVGRDLVHPEDREWVVKTLNETLSSSADEISMEHRSLTKDGSVIWMHNRGKIERDAAGKASGIYGIAMDVTERRKTEEVLRRAEKLAAAGRLAATVAHETNNPLEAVTNLVYLAKNTAEVPDEVVGYLATAEEELGRVAQIVKQTLGFYRESAKPVRTEIGLLITEMVAIYRRRMQAKKIDIECAIEAGLYAVVVAGEIKQVVANLLANALDATTEGGTVRISAKTIGTKVTVSITDTGHGIWEEDGKRLFEPFFTTRKEIGTGLGLWVSKGIIEKHAGEIHFTSRPTPPDQGTTFTFSLERSVDRVMNATADPPPAAKDDN